MSTHQQRVLVRNVLTQVMHLGLPGTKRPD